jgi:hypothetical protein
MNKIRRIAAVSLIIIGSFLEIYFYVWRFNQDGLGIWLPIVIGTGLTMLLIIAVYSRKQKVYYWLIVPLAFYSIFATSAGQAFSLGEQLKETENINIASKYNLEEITDTESQIDWYNDEIGKLSESIQASSNSLEDRYHWKNTIRLAQERQDKLISQRATLSGQLRELRAVATEHTEIDKRPQNIYTFYSGMIGTSEYWLQFILQTILSAFIAIMSPVGLILFMDRKPPGGKVAESVVKYSRKVTENIPGLQLKEIEDWVSINWVGIRHRKSKDILMEKDYRYFKEKHLKIFNKAKYDRLLEIAIKLYLVASDRRIIEKREHVAIEAIMEYVKGE